MSRQEHQLGSFCGEVVVAVTIIVKRKFSFTSVTPSNFQSTTLTHITILSPSSDKYWPQLMGFTPKNTEMETWTRYGTSVILQH